jgi:putative photosynthetic complex assembly protein 2
MSASPWIAALGALFLWWFSTGAILLAVRVADRRGPRAGQMVTFAALPILALGILGYLRTLDDGSAAGAYLGFLSALAIWGWIELAFLTGLITGPNLRPCPEDCPGWERFLRAWGTIAWHEMLLAGVLFVMAVHGLGFENVAGLWTFVVLYVARLSAKLNLFFGVPRINTEFIPSALAHLPSHFRRAPMNWLFPISVTGLSFAVACWLERLWSAGTPGETVGFALLAAITALALLEHWLMVVPLPDAKLWRWMLPEPKPQNIKGLPEGHHGF